MAEVAMGKLLPNLKITLGNESDNDLLEEGEIFDSADASDAVIEKITKKNVDIVRSWVTTLQTPKIYENKNGSFVTGLDLSSEVLMKKLVDRAERFGLEKKKENQITQKEIDGLYKSLDIDPENLNTCKLKNIRLDALHMRGVEEMSTNDIFKYFGDYGPASVEWINDFSCNVVWLDEATTARALLGMSQALVVKKKSIKQASSDDVISSENQNENETAIEVSESEDSDDDDDRLTIDSKTESTMEVEVPMDQDTSEDTVASASIKDDAVVTVPVPPGHWRLGVAHSKAKTILLRFATKDDKKLPGAEKRSHYYQKYGNPNYGGLKGIISTSKKRKLQAAKNREIIGKFTDNLQHHSDTEGDLVKQHNRMKLPRMRMYADDEEEKRKRIKLGHTNNVDSKPGNIYSRLGKKYTKDDLFHLGSRFSSGSDEEEPEDNVIINCTVPSRYNIWTDIAKSFSKEEFLSSQNDEDSNYSRDSRFEKPYNRNSSSSRSQRDLRSSLNQKSSQNFKSKDYSRSRSPPGNQRSGDLRQYLSSSKNVSRHSNDLRSKIRRLNHEKNFLSKHRSPLCMDD